MGRKNDSIFVRTSKGMLEPFDRQKIVNSLMNEAGLDQTVAEAVAHEVEVELRHMDLEFVSAPLIRELVNVKLLEHKHEEARKVYTRVGLPINDVERMMAGTHWYSKENANLQRNPETVHKLIADHVIREYTMLKILPVELGDMHMKGAIHIHELEYFPSRPFCASHDARFFFKHGFIADGTGTHTAVAGPAKKAEVALLHALKVLQASQVNCGGGQGLHDFNVFMAPYLRGLNYEALKQLAQTMFFELGEMYVARGGQTVFSSVSLEPGVPKTYESLPAVGPGGKNVGVYGDYSEEATRFFDAILDVALDGDYMGKPFNWPKLEVRLTHDWMKKYEKEYLLSSQLAAKFGSTYYFNAGAPYMPGEMICVQCFPAYEVIPTLIDGHFELKEIGEIVEEEKPQEVVKAQDATWLVPSRHIEVLTIDSEFHPSWKRVNALLRRAGENEVIRFRTRDGRTLHVTKDHPMVVYRNGSLKVVPAKDLREGEFLIELMRYEIIAEALNEINVPDVLDKLGILYTTRNGKVRIRYGKVWVPAKIPINRDFMRLLGYYLAEGCSDLKKSTKDRRAKVRISFNPSEVDAIEEVKGIVDRLFGLKPSISVERDGKRNATVIGINSKIVTELFLEYLKVGRDSNSKRVPSLVFTLPEYLIQEMLDAYFLGDGYCRRNAGSISIEAATTSRELAYGLQYALMRLGIGTTIRLSGRTHRISIQGGIFLPRFIEGCPSILRGREFEYNPTRHHSSMSEALPASWVNINAIEGGYTRTIIQNAQHQNLNVGLELVPPEAWMDETLQRILATSTHLIEVREVTHLKYDGYVYDLEVEENHLLFAGHGLLTHNCCRYYMVHSDWNDQKDLINGTVRGGIIQNTTVNMPQCAYEAKGDDDRLFEGIRARMEASRDVSLIKANEIKKRLVEGFLPFLVQPIDDEPYKMEWCEYDYHDGRLHPNSKQSHTLEGTPYLEPDRQGATIGALGLNEMLKAHVGEWLHEGDEAWRFGLKTIQYMRGVVEEFTKETGTHFGVVQSPAESCAHRLAMIDVERYGPKAVVQGEPEVGENGAPSVYYTNSTHVPVSAQIPLETRIRIESSFHPLFNGGTIMHVFLGEAFPDSEALWRMTERIATKTLVGYFAYTKDVTICKHCKHVNYGLLEECPDCGAKGGLLEHWSRITGYYQEVSGWNAGKKAELRDRFRYGASPVT